MEAEHQAVCRRHDEGTRRIYIVDRSFYLWRKHQKLKDLLAFLDLPPETERVTA